jgi:hypothetical protein
MENYCWKKNYVYALVTIYKTILHYHRCFRYWSSLYLVNKNMDCWVEINIKLDIFLDSICCLQHTWKEGYGNDCLCFVFFFLNYWYLDNVIFFPLSSLKNYLLCFIKQIWTNTCTVGKQTHDLLVILKPRSQGAITVKNSR